MKNEVLRMHRISKSFFGVEILRNVNLNLFEGEVLGLIGGNGAGKTSLIKILCGIYKKDVGRLYLEEKEVTINSPSESQKQGIICIHQEPKLVNNMSVGENIFLIREDKKSFFYNKNWANRESEVLLKRVGLEIKPECIVRNLNIAQRKMVELAKALSFDAKIIVMDEITSSMSEKEIVVLKNTIDSLKKQGISIIFISHKLEEVMDLCDRITVLRDGRIAGTLPVQNCTKEMLISLMLGRNLKVRYTMNSSECGEEVLRVENISTPGFLKNINFTLRKGEILGFAGLIGAGRTELMNVLFGVNPLSSGDIYIRGKKKKIKSPWHAVRNKIGMIPEDRHLLGLVLDLTAGENIIIPIFKKICNAGWISSSIQKFITREYIKKLNIQSEIESQKVLHLSGGNQQKVLVAKWMAVRPQILIMDEPTKGIDLGAKEEIHDLCYKLRQEGVAVILISSDLSEILSLSDRIIVMHDGEIKGELKREEATQERIVKMEIDEFIENN